MDILILIIVGIVGVAGGFGIAKYLEKTNVSNLVKNAKKEASSILKDANTEAENIKKDKIFIMGDFNDKYDSIRKLTILKYILSYNGTAPTSCCYNWNSSCSNSRFLNVKLRVCISSQYYIFN